MDGLFPGRGGTEVMGGAVELARKAILLVETQSSSWSVRLYMIFFIIWRWQGNMRQDKDIDCLPGC